MIFGHFAFFWYFYVIFPLARAIFFKFISSQKERNQIEKSKWWINYKHKKTQKKPAEVFWRIFVATTRSKLHIPFPMLFHQLLHSGRTEGSIEVSVQLHLGQRPAELEAGRRAHPLFAKATFSLGVVSKRERSKSTRDEIWDQTDTAQVWEFVSADVNIRRCCDWRRYAGLFLLADGQLQAEQVRQAGAANIKLLLVISIALSVQLW